MKNENHVITNDEVREAELKRSTLELFRECGTHIAFIENHPILRDHTYTEILKDSRGAFKQALAGRRVIDSDLYEANGAIAFALMHLKSQSEMLERLLAQFDTADHDEKKKGTGRAAKGKKRTTRKKIKGAWRSAADVAEDFNKAAFMPKGGKRKLGTYDEAKINRWDADCPDYEHKNKWGYYAELRVDSNLKNEYHKVLVLWNLHWQAYKKWDKQHPGVKFREMIRTDIDPERISIDTDGKKHICPVNDDEKLRMRKVMNRKKMSTKYLRLQHF